MMVLLPVCAVATCGVLIGLLNRQTATMTVREIEGKPILLSSGNTLIPMPTPDRPLSCTCADLEPASALRCSPGSC